MNKKVGRPQKEFARSKRITSRFTSEEYDKIVKKAKEKKTSLSNYIRDKVLTK